jgi:hypothetical protein
MSAKQITMSEEDTPTAKGMMFLVKYLIWLFVISVGFFLYFAAFKKAIMIGDPQWRFSNSNWSFLYNIGLIVLECLFGTFLLFSFTCRPVRIIGAIVFFAFGYYQLHLIRNGISHCDCFGKTSISPVIMLRIDTAIAIGFAAALFLDPTHTPTSLKIFNANIVVGSMSAMALVGFVFLAQPIDKHSTSGGIETFSVSGDRYQVLKPRSWIGSEFPFSASISSMSDSSPLQWTDRSIVILAREGCGSCKEMITQCEDVNAQKILLFVKRPESIDEFERNGWECFTFDPSQNWVCKVPTLLTVDSGLITGLFDLSSLDEFPVLSF